MIDKFGDVPRKVVFSLFDSEIEFADYVKMTIAKDLYKNRNVSLEHCAAIAEMSAKAFAKCMEEIEIPSFVFESDAELKEKLELDYADVLAGRVKPAKETFEEIRKRMLSYFSAVTTEGVQSILAMFYMSSARKGDFLLLGLLLLLLIINQAAINNK